LLELNLLVAGFADGLLRVIDRATYNVRRVLSAGPYPIHCVALVPRLRMVVAGTCKGVIAAWQVMEVSDQPLLEAAPPASAPLARRKRPAPDARDAHRSAEAAGELATGAGRAGAADAGGAGESRCVSLECGAGRCVGG